MKIVQTVFGAFHHFELAHELHRRRHLQKIYSTWPWARLKREGLPREMVDTFPWLHLPEMLMRRAGIQSTWLYDQIGYANALSFDRWTAMQMHKTAAPDALIAISGSSLMTGRMLQQDGTVFICDRGSSHQRFQEEIVSDEYRRWGVNASVSDIRDTVREEEIYLACDAISVPSGFAARSFIQMGIAAEKLHVIPYGVRLENFKPVTAPPPISERFELLFAGQVGLRKGVPYLLEAFQKLRHPNKRLRVVGGVTAEFGPVLEKLPKEGVEFLGILPQPELARIMSGSHLLVLPSIEEGLALVQGQALACGCPVLASTNTGGEDLFSDGREGFIVPIRDVQALTDRMQQFADEPGLYERMHAAALERVRSIGGWSEYGDRWEKLLLQLTGSRR